MMVVNSPHQQQRHQQLNGHAMGCRQQQQVQHQHQQNRRSKAKVQQYHPTTMQSINFNGLGRSGSPGDKTQARQVPAKSPSANGGHGPGHRSPPSLKATFSSKSPPLRMSPGTMAAYAGAKFSAAPPSPHSLPKPPASWWANSNPSLTTPMQLGHGSSQSSTTIVDSMAANSYGNLISNHLKLMLNVQA